MATQTLSLGVELPELSGSPKQVEWANKERATLISVALERLVQRVGMAHLEANPAERELALRVLGDAVKAHTDARWWIDHRGYVDHLLAEARPALRAGYAALKATGVPQ